VWSILGVCSAVLLGFYDVLKKQSLRGNFVLPVLFIATVTGALIFFPILLLSHLNANFIQVKLLYVPPIDLISHLLILLKSALVASSWIFAYFAFKHLPITIASPIRASGPLWTLLGALLIFGEHMNIFQWSGIIVTIIFYYIFSLAGKMEGINFRTNKWVLFIVTATILGSISALYDKYLVLKIGRMAVQAWYSQYLVLVLLPVLLVSKIRKQSSFLPVRWSWTIPLIGITLSVADFVYFYAIALPGALIAVISTLRRSSVLVSFIVGAAYFKDKNIGRKFLILLGILAGILLIVLGSQR
jgi:bacterial/archaeal transporter family protein